LPSYLPPPPSFATSLPYCLPFLVISVGSHTHSTTAPHWFNLQFRPHPPHSTPCLHYYNATNIPERTVRCCFIHPSPLVLFYAVLLFCCELRTRHLPPGCTPHTPALTRSSMDTPLQWDLHRPAFHYGVCWQSDNAHAERSARFAIIWDGASGTLHVNSTPTSLFCFITISIPPTYLSLPHTASAELF